MTDQASPVPEYHRVRHIPMSPQDTHRLRQELIASKKMPWPNLVADSWGISVSAAEAHIKHCFG